MSLSLKPTANVTVQVSSADTTVANVSPATLTFTPQNYAERQSVAITGVDDDYYNDINGRHRKTTIGFAASGGNYQGVTRDVTVTVVDNEPPRDITVWGYDIIQEGGENLLWPITLRTKPTGTVTVRITQSAGPKVIALDRNALTFTPSNWDKQQVVKLTARDDDSRNAQFRQRLQFTLAASGQGDYDGYSTTHRLYFYDDEPVPYQDDEGKNEIVPVRVYICEPPHNKVIWDITSSDPDVVGVSPGRLVWTSQNTGTTQPFILTFHENDDLGDGFARISIRVTDSCPRPKIHRLWDYTIRDNDTGSVIVDRIEDAVGVGLGVTYEVVLDARPSGIVTVTASSDATGFATVHSGQQEGGESVVLRFGQRDWDRPRYVSVYGQAAGSATISHTAAGGGYDGVEVDSVAVTVTPHDILPDDNGDNEDNDFDNDDGGTPPERPTVGLSATPNPRVAEGSPIVVTATLSEALAEAVTVPLELTPGTAEPGDYGALPGIEIAAGQVAGTGVLTTARDGDPDDETFTVALGALPPPVAAGSPSSLTVTIMDGDSAPAAADDMAETPEDEPAAIDALANDADPDGDALRVASVTQPAHGTVSVAPDGTLAYAPDPDFHGVDAFEYAAADPGGLSDTATVTVTVAPVNDGPRALSAIPGQLFDEGGGGAEVELSRHFGDADGDALSYRASSSDTDVVAVAVDGSALALTPVAYGSAVVTVTARDSGGLEAAQTFAAVVDDRPVRAALDDTLAALARSHLASARMTLGRRVESAGGDRRGTRLTVAGRAVPTDRAALGRMLRGWLPDMARADSRSGADARPRGGAASWPGAGPPAGGVFAGGLDFRGRGQGAAGAWPAGAEFQLAAGGGGEGGEGGEGGVGRWSVWGQGDVQTFRGEPPESPYAAEHEGDLRTAYLGVDARLGARWLVGATAARSAGGGGGAAGPGRRPERRGGGQGAGPAFGRGPPRAWIRRDADRGGRRARRRRAVVLAVAALGSRGLGDRRAVAGTGAPRRRRGPVCGAVDRGRPPGIRQNAPARTGETRD